MDSKIGPQADIQHRKSDRDQIKVANGRSGERCGKYQTHRQANEHINYQSALTHRKVEHYARPLQM